jgi:hypothetical protein
MSIAAHPMGAVLVVEAGTAPSPDRRAEPATLEVGTAAKSHYQSLPWEC